ncbi:hypothetical protein CKAN_00312800 [Cinnamomum micranthum f. kanehirae]|uniref:Methyltransferase type 11 domain-containing protein n=1 Tax=Cinnamomum micranthum f. kanehirae TaxID=337451 RepID=A0A3S3N8L4_9MAGN|nr:hypothetical protein CKAN_00312800 [Cinnamomum micranthum f. kanehirae]
MDRHIRVFLRRVSCIFLSIGTLTLFLLFAQPPSYCLHRALTPFPKSSCESNLRRPPLLPSKLHTSRPWLARQRSYSTFFRSSLLNRHPDLLSTSSKVLCVSAGAGHQILGLSSLGVGEVTGVEIVESPPLVQRADPHNLPYFDGIFDLAFSAHLQEAMFPDRYAREMERTVRKGGACVVVVDRMMGGREGEEMMRRIRGLFGRSRFVGAWNVTLLGSEMTQIVMRVTNNNSTISVSNPNSNSNSNSNSKPKPKSYLI